MASNWTRPFELTHPLDMRQVEQVNSMFQKLFSTIPLRADRGGTGLGVDDIAIGDLLYGSAVDTLATLASVAAGSYLRSAGLLTAPVWSTVKIPNTDTTGDLWYASATDTITALAIGTAGKIIRSTGTLPAWSTFTIPDTYAQGDLLYASATNVLTALVKDANATRYLSNKGASNAPSWSQVTLTNGVTGTLPWGNGGTGTTSFTTGAPVYAVSSSALGSIVAGLTGSYLRMVGSDVAAWSILTLPNASAQGDIFISTATSVMTVLAKNASATRYLSNTGTSNNPAWAQVDLSNGVTGDLPFANLTQGAALSVLGVTGNATADNASIAAASDFQVLRRSGTAVAFGAVALAQSAAVTGALAIANGGTGQTTAGPAQGALNAEFSFTTTGNIDNLDFSNASIIRANNASLATIRGLVAGTAGQRVTIVSIGAGQVDINDQDANSTAANRIITGVSLPLSLAAGIGQITLQYDGTTARWRVVSHEQGAWIAYTPTWSSTGTAPAIGNGTLTGKYYRRGQTGWYKLNMTAGTTTTFGTGVFLFTTSFTGLDATSYAEPGPGLLNDASVGQYIAQTVRFSSTQVYLMTDTTPNGVTGTNVFTFTTDDSIVISGYIQA